MKIKRTSWHAKFYKAIYVTDTLPTNLCPYFWKLVLAVITLPITSVSFFGKCYRFADRFSWLAITIFIEHVVFAIGLCFSLMFGLVPIKGLFTFHDFLIANGMGIVGVAGIALIMFTWCKVAEYNDRRMAKVKAPKVKQPNVLVEFVKAKKNKHCPMIEWED